MGSSPAAGMTATYAAMPFPSDRDAYSNEGDGLPNLEADGPSPPPSWLVCGFY